MKFCKKCGKQIADGQICDCTANQAPQSPQASTRITSSIQPRIVPPAAQSSVPPQTTPRSTPHIPPHSTSHTASVHAAPLKINKTTFGIFIESMLIRMGIRMPASNTTDPFERGMLIVPDCISPNEGEIPVKQYNIATLSGSFVNADGRFQITNKRLIFRATGLSLFGYATQHNEFAIDEIAGLEAVRGNSFNSSKFLKGIIVILIAAFISASISLFPIPTEWTVTEWRESERIESHRMQRPPTSIELFTFDGNIERLGIVGGTICLILGFGGLVPFFMVKKRFLLKLFLLGAGHSGFAVMYARWDAALLLLIISFITIITGLILYSSAPQMILSIKNKGALSTVDIRSGDGWGLVAITGGRNASGFALVEPTEETDEAIREIGAIISDIQKLGDHGVNKWL